MTRADDLRTQASCILAEEVIVDVTAEDFRRHYEILSDEALLDIDTGELVELARTCLAEEVARRGLDLGASGDGETADPAHPATDSGDTAEELVCIAEYDYLDEADLARGLLAAAEIPVSFESDTSTFRLMVPAGVAEQALQMLVTPLTDEELAAQAEAAGHPDEGSYDDAEQQAEEYADDDSDAPASRP